MSTIVLDLNDPAGYLPAGCENEIKTYLARALEINRVARAAACLNLVDGQEIRRLNREYRNTDRETDVLSFPLNELTPGAFDPEECERDWETGAVMLGDMMISIPACERQGEEFGHGFDREIQYLTVHSVLHLLGYDHVDEGEQKRQMRAREKAIMGDRD